MMHPKICALLAAALLVPAFGAGCKSSPATSAAATLPMAPLPLTPDETKSRLTYQLDKYDSLTEGSGPQFDLYTFALADREATVAKLKTIVDDLVRAEELVWAKRVLAFDGFSTAPRRRYYTELGDLVKVAPQMIPGTTKVPEAAKLIGPDRLMAYAKLLAPLIEQGRTASPLSGFAAAEAATLSRAQFDSLPPPAGAGLRDFLMNSLNQDWMSSGTTGVLFYAYVTTNPDKRIVREAVRQALSSSDGRNRAAGELTEGRFVFLYNRALDRDQSRAFGPTLAGTRLSSPAPQYDLDTPSQIYQIYFADVPTR
jgi:hypothetical protein